MRILQLGKAYPPANLGGVEVVIQLLTEGLNKHGVYCDALGVNDEKEYRTEFSLYGGKIYRTRLIIKLFSTLLSFQLITCLWRLRSKYDIIHLHSPDPMAALALFLVRPKVKLVVHWHSDILKQKFLLIFFKPILKWILNRANLILATSPNYVQGSELLMEYYSKVKILPIGIDVSVSNSERLSLQEYQDKKIIFSLGRLAYYKGYEYLVESALNLPDEYIILIAGHGPEYNKLNKLILDNNLSRKVKLLGKVNDYTKNRLFSSCFLFALSSIYKTEAYAIVQVEALAFGKPIVSTRIPGSGVDWVNKHEVSGLTVPIRDSKALADAIKRIGGNSQLHEEYSSNALKRYNDKFTQDKMITELINYYSEL